jgi:methyl-accepting chemotaxis protein/methyl-accepting chemotaxis protein-1 (serine sensor receptor)
MPSGASSACRSGITRTDAEALKMARKTSFQTKLFGCFGCILLFALGASVYSLYTLRGIRSQLKDEIDASSLRLDQSRQIAIGLANMRTAMRGISLFAMMQNPEGVTKARALYEASAQQMQGVVQEMEAASTTGEDRAVIEAIRSGLDQWVRYMNEFTDLSISGHAEEAAQGALKKMTPFIDVIQKNAAEFGKASRVRHDAAVGRVDSVIDASEMTSVVLSILLLCAAAVACVVVLRLTKALKSITREVAGNAEQVASAASQISAASQSLAQGSSDQAASLEETSASTEEISATARRNKDNTQTAASLVEQSGARFQETNRALDLMVKSIGEINASSDKISRIIKVIEEIAFQTNILALNAAVEAARAGQAGTGFAVVADEVRNLAHRCTEAARDTSSLIEESITTSGEGKTRVDQVAGAIRAITEDAVKVKALVEEVNLSSQEQAAGIEQIGRAVAQMEHVTQGTAANAEETASAAKALSAQSEGLHAIAEELTALVGASER